jgi:Cu/Ag efflux protein CusF
MNQLSINIIKTRIQLAIAAMACLLLLTTNAAAHGDEIHVIGVISKISATSVSVTTKDGKTVDVQFGDKTSYLRLKQPIEKSTLKVGDRVVIHAMKVKEDLVAHTVEIGAAQH